MRVPHPLIEHLPRLTLRLALLAVVTFVLGVESCVQTNGARMFSQFGHTRGTDVFSMPALPRSW
jgi:hypothetical protein